MTASHDRGTAAEQGAALRKQLQPNLNPAPAPAPAHHQQLANGTPSSLLAGAATDTQSAPVASREQEPPADSLPSTPADERFQDAPDTLPAPIEQPSKASVPSSAQHQESVAHDDTRLPSKSPAQAAPAAATASSPPHGHKPTKTKSSPFSMPRVQTLTGIDNLALLLEDETYHPACFSIYTFESDLDRSTAEAFFDKLVELFPKYSYKVELDPSKAAKLDKLAQERQSDVKEKGTGLSAGAKERRDHFDAGRKTHYAKGIKAGGPWRPAKWRILDDFDIRENIEEETLSDGKNDDDAVFQVAGKFLERHFNYAKPLWEAKLIHNLNMKDGSKSGLMIKIHHALSDGQGLIQSYGVALSAMAEGASRDEVQRKLDQSPEVKKPGQRGVKPTIWGTVKHSAKTVAGLCFRSRQSFIYGPNAPKHRVAERRYAHSQGIRMEDIKLVREAFSTPQSNLTLNDVACALLSRSIGIAAKRVSPTGVVKDKRIAIFVPISVRPKGNYELANYTTGAIAWFKLDEKMSLEDRLAQVNREMMRIKKSYLPKLWYNTFGSICKRRILYTPHYPVGKELFQKAYRVYSPATNVPGPSKPVRFGQHVANRYFVLPPSSPGKSTLAIGMISYAGEFSIAVSCDDVSGFERLCQEICESFHEGADELVQQARAKLASKKAQ